jgi:putative cell wall-binding protein/exopolysaccharide biosynthesis protein
LLSVRRRTLPTLALAALLAGPAVLTAGPRARAEPAGVATRLIAPGVELLAFTRTGAGGIRQEVRVLRFRLDDPRVSMRPVLAADHGASRRTVTDLVLRSGALAAINGNFFTAGGNVRGIAVRGGVLRSEPEAALGAAATPRAAWRIDGDSVLFGRPGSTLTATRGGDTFGLNGLDRAPGYLGNPDETVLVTSKLGATTRTPATGVDVVLAGIDEVHANQPLSGTVAELRTGPGAVPVGSAVLSATGNNAADLSSRLAVGDELQARIDIDDPGFAAAAEAGGGGPWLVHEGTPVGRTAMLGEGFSPTHLDMRAPRSAMGLTSDGRTLLVTIDGRQTGRSEGATLDDLTGLMVELGALEAISLDGGGSTALSVDGRLENVPSGEDSFHVPGVQAALGDAVGVFFDFVPRGTRRLAGNDRIETAIAVAHELTAASTVVLATSTGFADALVGGPLAASMSAPVLLTGRDALDLRVVAELSRLGTTKVILLGGPLALGQPVADALAGLNLQVDRIAGIDRYDTAAQVAGRLADSSGTVLVASGETFPDALAAGALGLPVLLTTREALPDVVRTALGSATPVVVGGPAAVRPDVLPQAERLAGADRAETATRVADWGIARGRYNDAVVTITQGETFPDALVAGTLRRPLLLAGRHTLAETPPTQQWLSDHAAPIATAFLVGGRLVLSTMTHIEIDDLVAIGPVSLQGLVGNIRRVLDAAPGEDVPVGS